LTGPEYQKNRILQAVNVLFCNGVTFFIYCIFCLPPPPQSDDRSCSRFVLMVEQKRNIYGGVSSNIISTADTVSYSLRKLATSNFYVGRLLIAKQLPPIQYNLIKTMV